AGRQRLVEPVQLIVNTQIFPEGADDAAQPPLIGSTESNLLTQMRVALGLVPGGARREAGLGECAVDAVALVIVRILAARIVSVVLNRADVAREIRPGVDQSEVADSPIDRQSRVLEAILVVGVVEQRDRLQRKRCAA